MILRDKITFGGFLALTFAFTILVPGAVFAQNESGDTAAPLIPAAMGIRTDKQGNSWNIESNGTIGRIGSTMVNSGLVLSVNDEAFTSFQPMMSRDGNEFVLRGHPLADIPGLQLQRRIKLITGQRVSSVGEAGGGLRYAEMFYNSTTDPISFTVALTTNFSGNYKHFLSDRGSSEPVILGEGESGIIVLPGASQSTKAFLFSLADGGSSIKPTISAQNRYGLTFRYQVDLAPGETGVLLHRVAQVMIPGNFDRRTLLRLFSPYSITQAEMILDQQWSRYVLNAGNDKGGLNEHFPMPGFEALNIIPGESDTLALGDATRLPGTASSPGLTIVTSFGQASVALDEVAAIAGGKFTGGGANKLYLRDGQILSGSISAPDFVFKQKGGGDMLIDIPNLDRLVFSEQKPIDGAGEKTMLETFDGDRLLLPKNSNTALNGITPWGVMPFTLGQVVRLYPDTSSPGYRVQLVDGTETRIFPEGEATEVETERFGKVSIDHARIRSVVTGRAQDRSISYEPEAGKSVVDLAGLQRLVGEVGNSEIVLHSEGIPIATRASEIRSLVQTQNNGGLSGALSVNNPTFRIERWDGGVVEGSFESGVFSVSVSDAALSIPVQDVARIKMPLPALNAEKVAEIRALITQLADPSWAERENATVELGAFGYLAGSVLRRERQKTEDVEVARRIDRVLNGLD